MCFSIFTLGVLNMRQQVGNIYVIWVARAIPFSDLIYHFIVSLKTSSSPFPLSMACDDG